MSYICKYCNKEFETKHKLAGHTTHCILNPNYERNYINCQNLKASLSKRIEIISSICPYCNKEITSTKSGITFHINRCKENPNRKNHPGNKGHTIGHTAWNKGMTAETNEVIKDARDKLKYKYQTGELIGAFKGKHHTQDTKNKLSLLQQEKVKNNSNYIKSCGRAKKYNYKGVSLDGTWELLFAQYLDENNIRWERPKIPFEYIYNETTHLYYPDFYLSDIKIYVEIKGYERDIDRIKWESVRNSGYKIIIIKYSQINQIRNKTFDISKYI